MKNIDYFSQLANATNLRSSQDREQWRVFQIFWAANAILIVALFSQGEFPKNSIGAIISIFGAVMSWVWFMIHRRVAGHVKRYEVLIERLERKLKIPPRYSVSTELNKKDRRLYLNIKPSARTVMAFCSIMVPIIWSLVIIIFIAKLLNFI